MTGKAKPYDIKSIDPENPGEPWGWSDFVGLGIGQRIYQKAQELEPQLRWDHGTLSDYSRPLRKKLHSADPYVCNWSSCPWCRKNVPLPQPGFEQWRNAGRSAFTGHE